MSHAAKIMERMILERLMPFVLQVEGAIPDMQFRFIRDRNTMDAQLSLFLGVSQRMC